LTGAAPLRPAVVGGAAEEAPASAGMGGEDGIGASAEPEGAVEEAVGGQGVVAAPAQRVVGPVVVVPGEVRAEPAA
jgi:hypothetical protein